MEDYKNALRCSVDWISFTVHDLTFDTLIAFLGLSRVDLSNFAHGAKGYKVMYRHFTGMTILSEGNVDMGIHVDIPGSAIPAFFEIYKKKLLVDTPWGDQCVDLDCYDSVLSLFISRVLDFGSFSRLDLAIDDTVGYYSVDEIRYLQDQTLVVSKFRIYNDNVTRKIIDNDTVGHTIYYGQRSSSVMLRIYDKKLEQNSKHGDDEKIDYDWVRWELELKDDRANSAARALISDSVGNVAIGILSQYFRLIVRDNDNRSRCSTQMKWKNFTDKVSRLRLSVPKNARTLRDVEFWINKQVMPSITALVLSDYGSLECITDKLEDNIVRINSEIKRLILEKNPHAFDDLEF